MKKALFIGSVDISDLLLYVSKIITTSGKKVLLVDGTTEKYIQYNTPKPSSKLSIVEFDGFDVAVGYNTFKEIETYLVQNQQYEQLIVHCSNVSFVQKADLNKFDFKYIATSQEKISLDKTVEYLASIFGTSKTKDNDSENIQFSQVFVNYTDANMAQDYLETVLGTLPVSWSEEPYEILYDEVDYSTKINNQHEGKINIRRLSRNYKKIIQRISEEIAGLELKEIKPAMKQVMRRSFAWGK